MKKKQMGRPKMKDKEKATIQIPVRLNEQEEKLLKKLTKHYGERYMTRTIRRLIADATSLMAL